MNTDVSHPGPLKDVTYYMPKSDNVFVALA